MRQPAWVGHGGSCSAAASWHGLPVWPAPGRSSAAYGVLHACSSSRFRTPCHAHARLNTHMCILRMLLPCCHAPAGKIGAQCAHAAVGLVERLGSRHSAVLRQWEACGQPKICLRAESSQQLVSVLPAHST